MKHLFDIGQVVICINDNFSWCKQHYPDPKIGYPVFGQRYIVREYLTSGKYAAIAVQEIHNPVVQYLSGEYKEAGFWDRRFVGAPPPEKKVVKKEKEMVL
jgi:hypothetical protein